MKPTISKPFKSNDRTFEKVFGLFNKKDYFNVKGLAKVQIGNFERALQKNDKNAQQVLDMFKGDDKKAKEYIIQVIHDRKKEQAFNDYKALKDAVDSIQKGKPNVGAVDYVKRIIHNNNQKYSIALYSTLRNKKFTKWKDVHNDIDSLIGESVNENRFLDALKDFFSKEEPTFKQMAKRYKKKADFIKWFVKSQAKMGVVFKNDGYGAYMMNRMGKLWDRVHGQPEDKKYVGESVNEGLKSNDMYTMLDIAAGYSSTQDQAANQMWSDEQDLYDYLKSDHIPKKYHKKFHKDIKRRFKNIKESVVNEGKVHFEKKLKNGNIFQVIDRDTKGMRGTQDKFSMQIVDKRGKVVKNIGSHPSLDGAKKYSKSVKEGKKRFKRQDGIGKAKYTISFHDGKKKHKDGSDFFDIKIFKNKKDLSNFVGTLVKQGYKLTRESLNEEKEPEVISQIRDIVKRKQNKKIKDPISGKMMRVDLYSASAITQVYDAINKSNKDKFGKLSLPKMVNVAFSVMKKR